MLLRNHWPLRCSSKHCRCYNWDFIHFTCSLYRLIIVISPNCVVSLRICLVPLQNFDYSSGQRSHIDTLPSTILSSILRWGRQLQVNNIVSSLAVGRSVLICKSQWEICITCCTLSSRKISLCYIRVIFTITD